MAIYFHYQKEINIQQRTRLKQIIETIFKKEKRRLGKIDYIFCDDDYILDINKRFLQHNYYTDIITFDLSTPGKKLVDAEIYISIDTVTTNALKYKVPKSVELRRVIFHGALHLCGYKDKAPKDQKLMRQMEDKYLNMFHGEH